MLHNKEYTKPSVSGNGCAYSTLNAYNQNYFGNGAPVASQLNSNQTFILPSYGAPGYSTDMEAKKPSCSGYFSVRQAYSNYPGSCNAFSSSLC